MKDIRLIYPDIVFPECPRWRDGALWFSDCNDGWVIAIDPEGRLLERFETPGRPAGLGWLPDGRMLVVSIEDLCVYRKDADGVLRRHADLRDQHSVHTNDMVVDDQGNAYVGEVGFRFRKDEPRATTVALVRPDGRVEVAADDVMTPNGCAITPDGRTFVLAESLGRRITAFDRAADGTLSNRRVFAQLDEADIPDGLCLDDEGCAWTACPFTGVIVRASPTQGVVERIEVDPAPYACVFGGADRRTLYICCAADHEPGGKVSTKRSGVIAAMRVDVAGAGIP